MIPTEATDDLRRRLRRAEGQVRGIQRMLAEDRPCRDISIQLSAVIAALEGVRRQLVLVSLRDCDATADPDARETLERLLLSGR